MYLENKWKQWRIQDFPKGGGVNPPRGGVNTQFCQILPKTAWNWKNLDAEGGACVPHAPLRSATGKCWSSQLLCQNKVMRCSIAANEQYVHQVSVYFLCRCCFKKYYPQPTKLRGWCLPRNSRCPLEKRETFNRNKLLYLPSSQFQYKSFSKS